MRQILLQNVAAILLQNATEVYYKIRQFFYYKMRQFYYKKQQLLQIAKTLLQYATFITNCGSTPWAIHFFLVWPNQSEITQLEFLQRFLKRFCPIFFFFKIVVVFLYCLKTPNLTFQNLVIQQYNVSSIFLNLEYVFNRLSPICSFFKWFFCPDIVWKYPNSCYWVWSCYSKIFHWNLETFNVS